MTLRLTITRDPLLIVVLTGEGRLNDYIGAIDQVAETTHEHHDTYALADLLGARPILTADEHKVLGSYLAKALAHMDRLACVVPEDQRVGTGEAAAKKDGLNIRTFTESPVACAWLLSALPVAQ